MHYTFRNMAENGITLSSSDSDGKVPSHIRQLRRFLTDCDDTVHERFRLKHDDDYRAYRDVSAFKRLGDEEQAVVREAVEFAHATALEAAELVEKPLGEKGWEAFFRARFFEPLYRGCKESRIDTRHTRRRKLYSDFIKVQSEDYWDLFNKKKGYRTSDRQGLWKPKPGFALYFPIHNKPVVLNHRLCDGLVSDESGRHEPLSDLAKHFTMDVLGLLGRLGLYSCPKLNLRAQDHNSRNDKFTGSNMICFPWLVCELKKDEKTTREKCICQAANASAAAVMMMQAAIQYAEPRTENAHVALVVSITATGPPAELWITYLASEAEPARMIVKFRGASFFVMAMSGLTSACSGEERDAYVMVAVRIFNLTNVWEVIEFVAVLENVHVWATQTLKPQLSMYIGQWLQRHGASFAS